jgi:hypothetical protein
MEKDKISYDEKLRGVILNIIFGYSGQVKMYDLFVKYLVAYLKDSSEIDTKPTDEELNEFENSCNVYSIRFDELLGAK